MITGGRNGWQLGLAGKGEVRGVGGTVMDHGHVRSTIQQCVQQ